jgi:putative ABC transport system ATP-binding protein
MNTPIVEARSLRKTYDTGAVRVDALRGVDLVLEHGEMVAIMGPSGCGKTTLLNCLSGLDSIDGGEAIIEGTPLSEMSDRERTDYRARRMGFVFQFYNLIPVLTALENVELPLLLTKLSKSQRRDRALTALKVVGLADRSKHYPRQLSGGQEQRVAIARAIVTDPTLLLADEPTGDLDAKSAGEVLTLLQRLNQEFKKTIVMVTHDPHAAERATHLLHLEKGTLVERHDMIDVEQMPARQLEVGRTS